MAMDLRYFARVNLARCLRWHPGGLESWSLSDWAAALAGEVGEVCGVVQAARTADMVLTDLAPELGDVMAYADLFAQAAGLSLADCIQQTPRRIGGQNHEVEWETVSLAAAAGQLCDIVKKLNRVRDGLPGNKATPEELRHELRYYLGLIGRRLESIAEVVGLNIDVCTRDKFNAVSERVGFPERV